MTLCIFVRAGTVIAGGSSLILVADVPTFRSRNSSPMPGQGLQVQPGLQGSLTANGVVTLLDAAGSQVFSSPAGGLPSAAG